MSILSDKQIKALCEPPTEIFEQDAFYREVLNTAHQVPLGAQDQYWESLKRHYTRPATPEDNAKFAPMISPYNSSSVRAVTIGGDDPETSVTRKVLSFGSTSYGYDVSLGEEFKIFTNVHGGVIDPKKLDATKCLVDGTVRSDDEGAKYVILPPNSYLLGCTVEVFTMPRNVMALCVGKSTYARAGAIVNLTPIEPGFCGQVVIEISNSTSLPMKIYAYEGISQFVFFKGDDCETSYADRNGKYQHQRGITLGKV